MTAPHRALLFAAALAAGLAAAPAAQAFQFESGDGQAVTPPQNFMDLGTPSSAAGHPSSKFSDGQTAPKQDGFNVQFHEGSAWGGMFGGNSFHQRYNFDSQFDRYKAGH
jgi:hypothetical protein